MDFSKEEIFLCSSTRLWAGPALTQHNLSHVNYFMMIHGNVSILDKSTLHLSHHSLCFEMRQDKRVCHSSKSSLKSTRNKPRKRFQKKVVIGHQVMFSISWLSLLLCHLLPASQWPQISTHGTMGIFGNFFESNDRVVLKRGGGEVDILQLFKLQICSCISPWKWLLATTRTGCFLIDLVLSFFRHSLFLFMVCRK